MKRKTVKFELILSSMGFTLFMVSIFAVFYMNLLSDKEFSRAYEVLRERNRMINTFIDGYFTEIRNTIQFLAGNDDVQNAAGSNELSRQRALGLFNAFARENRNITFVYAGYANGLLLINDYDPPEGYEPVVRPWYQAALEAEPHIYLGLPYQEIKTKEWLFSSGKALPRGQGRVEGVIAMDNSIDSIASLLKERSAEYASSYSVVVRKDDEIIIHPDPVYLGKSLEEVLGRRLPTRETGYFEYKLEGVTKIACFSEIEDTEWTVITVVEKREITCPVVRRILINLLIILLLAVVSGIAASIFLSKRFSVSLIHLRERVSAIIEGQQDSGRAYKYPDNEIGIIAAEIELLTEKELYNRAVKLEQANRLLEEKNAQLGKMSVTDQLTGLYNRHKMVHELEKEQKRAERYSRTFSLILIDVDSFKLINDNCGHQAGDDVLSRIAGQIRKSIRHTDICARWGGEEFLVVCPETDLAGCRDVAEKIRSDIERSDFGVEREVTISAGCAFYLPDEEYADTVKRADKKLYEAKARGKNSVAG